MMWPPDPDAADQLHAQCGKGRHRQFHQHQRRADGRRGAEPGDCRRAGRRGLRRRHASPRSRRARRCAPRFLVTAPAQREHGLPDGAGRLECLGSGDPIPACNACAACCRSSSTRCASLRAAMPATNSSSFTMPALAARWILRGWRVINTRIFSAPVHLATIPAGTTIAPRSHYLLALAGSGLARRRRPAPPASMSRSLAGLIAGADDHDRRRKPQPKSVGHGRGRADQSLHQCFDRALAGFPRRHHHPAGACRRRLCGGRQDRHRSGRPCHEIATVTAVGKAATQTILAASTTPGATTIKVASARQCQCRRYADHRHRPAHGAGRGRRRWAPPGRRHRRHADGAAETAAYRPGVDVSGPRHRHQLCARHALSPSQWRCSAGAGQRRGAGPAAGPCASLTARRVQERGDGE